MRGVGGGLSVCLSFSDFRRACPTNVISKFVSRERVDDGDGDGSAKSTRESKELGERSPEGVCGDDGRRRLITMTSVDPFRSTRHENGVRGRYERVNACWPRCPQNSERVRSPFRTGVSDVFRMARP